MITKFGFILTLSNGRQYTMWRGEELIPPDAVEEVVGRNYAIYRRTDTGAASPVLLALYSWSKETRCELAFECSSVDEAEELVRIVRANEARGTGE